MKLQKKMSLSCNKVVIFSLLALFLVASMGYIIMEAHSMDIDSKGLNQLHENKIFIMETFNAINENPMVMLSSTIEIAKTAEPELYNSMLSQGREILPAVLSLLKESEPGSRRGELYMLYTDILEGLGEPVLSPSELLPAHTDDPPDDPDQSPAYVWWEKVDPSVYIPEPENLDNPPPDYIRWEPMLGSYIYADAYYVPELGMIVLEKFPELPPEPIYITVSVLTDGTGIASASLEQANIGDIVTLNHEAAMGYRFKEWNVLRPSEGLIITNNRFEVPCEDAKIVAVFEPISSLSITIFTDGEGKPLESLSSTAMNIAMPYTNTGDTPADLTMTVAVYDSDGKLAHVGTDKCIVSPSQTETFKVCLAMPQNKNGYYALNGYYATVFLWDSKTSVPVLPKYIFPAQ